MDNPGGIRQPGPAGGGGARGRSRGRPHKQAAGNPQLFDDTSTPQQPYPQAQYSSAPSQQYGYANQYAGPAGYDPNVYTGGPSGMAPQFPGGQFFQDPMSNVAMQYGQNLADQGKDYVHKNLEKYVSSSKLKYYFAVDTSYVGRKLGLLLFPYAHSDWTIQYNQDEPVAPRYEVNAPDLYIPVMAFVTYILMAGLVLGTKDQFTPESLGLTSSTALVWMIIELLALLLVMYVLNVTTDLKYLDLLSYCGYKYVGMIVCVAGSLLFHSTGYYIALLWTSCSIAFFLVRSLKMAIIPHTDGTDFHHGSKRRLYTLMTIALLQPGFIWWLTKHLIL